MTSLEAATSPRRGGRSVALALSSEDPCPHRAFRQNSCQFDSRSRLFRPFLPRICQLQQLPMLRTYSVLVWKPESEQPTLELRAKRYLLRQLSR
jgi:hypothetical protein